MISGDEQAILETVRTALGSSGLTFVGTGALRRCSELSETLDHTVLPEYRVEYSIKHARVVRSDAAAAIVDLDATIETVTTSNGFESRTKARAQGPVQLVREGETWKVADMVVDGVSLLSSFFENGVKGSAGGLTVTVLGGRVFPTHIWAYLELANDLERPVNIESVTVGHRRALLPGWRWARARLPVDTVPPGESRVDAVASLENAHAAAGVRLLLKSDVGLVDARPQSARRARRWVPLSVRYPWSWGTAIVTAMVVPTGVFFGWWAAGLLLVQISGVTLLSFERYLRKGVGRATLVRLCWTLAGVATGLALFLTNGGFGRFRGESEHERVTSYVEGVTGADVVSAQRVAEQDVRACHYGVWDVRTTKHRWWVVAARGRYAGLPVTLYDHGDFASAAKLISYKLKAQRQVATEMKKLLGERAKALLVTC